MAIPQVFKTGSATATGTIVTLGVVGSALPVGILIGGTFVGTVKVEVSYNPEESSPTWVQFDVDKTAPTTIKLDIPVKAVRLRCSAFTSGTIQGAIGTPPPQ